MLKITSVKTTVLAFLMLALSSSSVFPQEGDLKNVFLNKYKPEVENLVNFYNKVVIKAKRINQEASGQGRETIQDILYMSNGPLQRLDIMDYSQQDNKPSNTKYVWVANPQASFTLMKLPEKEFVLTDLKKDYKKQMQIIRLKGMIPFCSYCFLELTISEFSQKREFNVTKITTEDSMSVVNFGRLIPANSVYNVIKPINQVGELRFLPNNYWALKGYSLGTMKRPAAARESIEYEVKDDKIPIIKKFESWREDKDGKRSQEIRIDVTDFIFKDVDKEEFELSHFGLSNIRAGRTRTRPWYLWLGFAGIICLAFAVLFRRWARRARNQSAS